MTWKSLFPEIWRFPGFPGFAVNSMNFLIAILSINSNCGASIDLEKNKFLHIFFQICYMKKKFSDQVKFKKFKFDDLNTWSKLSEQSYWSKNLMYCLKTLRHMA